MCLSVDENNDDDGDDYNNSVLTYLCAGFTAQGLLLRLHE
jgi:hypothetical protein